MNKSKKLRVTIGIAVLALVVGGIITAAVFLDGIVKKGVETVGPLILKVPVTLDSVHIGLATGSAKVKGLVVGNPEGYQTPYAISVGLAEVGVNSFTVLSDKIVIRSVHVKSPEISFEGNPLGKNNLGDIMESVNVSAKSGGPPSTKTTKTGAKPARKIQVDDFLITGAQVHVNLTNVGGKEVNLTLPDIHLTNLGKGSDGLTPTDLTRAVMSAITAATIKAVANHAANDLGKSVGNLGKDIGKAAGTNLNKITKGLGDLFKK